MRTIKGAICSLIVMFVLVLGSCTRPGEPAGAHDASRTHIEMVQVPPGEVQLAQGLVDVSGFLIARFETTYELYTQVMDASVADSNTLDRPAAHISFWDAVRFANAVSELHGYRPVYELRPQRSTDTEALNRIGRFVLVRLEDGIGVPTSD